MKFKIVTDYALFEGTMETKVLKSRIARWALQLQKYNFMLEHRCRSRMKQKRFGTQNYFKMLENGDYNDYITMVKEVVNLFQGECGG